MAPLHVLSDANRAEVLLMAYSGQKMERNQREMST